MFKCRKTLNVSAVLVNWHFTASVVNLVIINAYLSYLRQSFINNAYSKIESLYLIAHPSKNVNALEVCWCSPFSIVKIYFHHRLHFFFFFLLHSSEHRSVFKRKVSSQMTFHFLCYFCHMVGFVILHVKPDTLLGVGEVSNTTVHQHLHSVRDSVLVIGIQYLLL